MAEKLSLVCVLRLLIGKDMKDTIAESMDNSITDMDKFFNFGSVVTALISIL